jgi:hypothetical protein
MAAARLFGLLALAVSPLCAEQREWTSSDGQTTFKADLVNAFGQRAFFQREDGFYYNLPLSLLSKPDMAFVLDWANQRDAKQRATMWNAEGVIPENIRALWPNRAQGSKDEQINVNEIEEPMFYALVMVQQHDPWVSERLREFRTSIDTVNAACPNLVEVLFMTKQEGVEYAVVRDTLAKHGGSWLFANEWNYKSNAQKWAMFWRDPNTVIHLLDAQGHILLDSSMKMPDGSAVNVTNFLEEMAKAAAVLQATGDSVPNPLVNQAAVDQLITNARAQKLEQAVPQPIMMGLEGFFPDSIKAMEGRNIIVNLTIDTRGRVESVAMREGGNDADLEAIRRAVTLWQFLPAFKEGEPISRTIGLPIKIKPKAPAPAQ